ncbi:hypothetical protein SLU01_34640 [Sporosarcina luteola]|uniref:Uncharacterized protein n=1 Tax=Sporosarcina luteola TaxID=582850 RepID=A0A511ZCK7_9BACL|nr:hypothetical protein [Sporosarcina luteola]GEN85152.1 hypothetical protein SLU01_34640 [Sporosarcina luteola]
MKKILTLLTATMMLLSIFIVSNKTAMASSLDEARIQVDGASDEISIQNSKLWEIYLNAVYEIGGHIANENYFVPAVVSSSDIPGVVGTTTGSRNYTKDESFARTGMNVQSDRDSMTAFGMTDVVNSWTKKIGIAVIRNSNMDIVPGSGKNVGHGEGVTVRNMWPGGYTVLFNIHDPIKWNVGVMYFINRPPCEQCLPLDGPQPYELEEQKNNMMLQKNYFDFENNRVFNIPQQEAFKENNTNSNLKTKKTIFSINDLMNDHFDEVLQDYVHSLKSFNIGDSIIVSDTITDIYYDSEKQTTSLGFDYSDKRDSNKISKIYWEFAGDLMSQFSIGDSVSFKTEVIPINRDLNLETLDILGYQAEVAPNIDSYLLSHLQKKLKSME